LGAGRGGKEGGQLPNVSPESLHSSAFKGEKGEGFHVKENSGRRGIGKRKKKKKRG